MMRDDIYALPLTQVGSFEFDEQVVRVFPDMMRGRFRDTHRSYR